ncbi:MAG: tetratricopeptide repeat protein, partial [Syntrophales bacterium]
MDMNSNIKTSFELKPKNFSKTKKEKARILIAQPSWTASQIKRDANQLFRLELTNENEEFLDAILAKGKDDKVDLIVFPEFSIPERYLSKIGTWSSSNEVLVVAGSTYLRRGVEFFNTASVFFEGIQHRTEKHNLSPHELSRIFGCGPSAGTDHLYFQNTPVGNVAVMICADEFHRKTRDEFLDNDLDILCVIACQSKGKEHHQSIDRIVKEHEKGIYIVYCNALCHPVSDGRSAFFAFDYNDAFPESREAGLSPNDGIDRRIVEMPSLAGCLIVECDLINKRVTFPSIDSKRARVKYELPFVFENRCLRQLKIDECKTTAAKPPKEKEEYQPSIPPVKTFVAAYIGRKTDIDYLNEFLCNSQKHFLLLYGVGGIGKSHLLYCCFKDYRGKTYYYHAVSQYEKFSLKRLFEICLIPKPDDGLSLEEKHYLFVERFEQNDVHLILDDYYEIQDEEVKLLLPKLIGIGKGKLLILSRVIPTQVIRLTNDYYNYKIMPLPETEFKQVILNYIHDKSINLTDDEIHLICEKAQGYPLGGQLIIDARPYSVNLNELLANVPKFEAELDPEGRDYSSRLLDRIFQKGNKEEIKLLCEFSALFGASDIETIRQLPSYNVHVFEGLHKRKSFIDMDAQGKFSSHSMIKDFAYHRLKNKGTLHLYLGSYFERRINGRTDADWKWLNEAILHYTRTATEELISFKHRVERNFQSRNIKGLIEEKIINTIRNYTTLINLYPDNPAYYNELGIAYRGNNQKENAIETFERALAVDPKSLPSLNELGITYRANNQNAKAIETFERALAIDPKSLPSLNELGITYRTNNQNAKAIETFERALAIDPKS